MFETASEDKRTLRLESENTKLKGLVGELALELKTERLVMKKRGPYSKVPARNIELLERVRALKADHPFWGYRRIWAHLHFVDERIVDKNREYRLMKEHRLTARGSLLLKAKRKPIGHKPRPSRPNQWWGIDMTKVMIEGFGWVYVVIVGLAHKEGRGALRRIAGLGLALAGRPE